MAPRALRRAAVVALALAATAALPACSRDDGEGQTTTTLATLPASTTTTVPPTTVPPAPIEYVVQRNDTMRRIAAKFDTTVEAILALNPKVTDPNKIQRGQKILIPPTTVPAGPTSVAPTPPSTAPPTSG